MLRPIHTAILVASTLLVVSPAIGSCPPKKGKPCVNMPPPNHSRKGPIIIPKPDQFATPAEYRAALSQYLERSNRDLKAGLITRETHNAEVGSIRAAMGRMNMPK